MQKTFIRYTFIIITSAIFLIFFINLLITLHTLESQQYNKFYTKSEQVIHTLENNQAELSILQENLDEDYLTRAKAAAYIFDTQEEISMNVDEMKYLATLLNVDELHVIDENGFIIAASVSRYVGFDMSKHEQSRAFLSLLESDEDYFIQEAQPNAADQKIMQYIGVTRKEKKGIVQVGFKPTRQLEAKARNTCEYIFSRFPTDSGEQLFAVDRFTGAILGHSGGMNTDFSAAYYQPEQLLECTKGSYKKEENGSSMYVMVREYGDILIGLAIPQTNLTHQLFKQVFNTLWYLLLIEAIILILLNYLVKRKVVNGIHLIIQNLMDITNGNLDTTVAADDNPELKALSSGINTMVKSIISISDRISAIIKISGIPLAAFEYQFDAKHVFVTSGFKELLDISEEKAKELCQDAVKFDKYIKNIVNNPLKGETDIFQINDTKYVRIHMSESSNTNLGVIIDISKDIIEKQQMQYENTHDTLTKLYKYSYFKQLASERLQNKPSKSVCAIVMLDLDSFKSINDTFGHDIGDKYLQHFSNIMRSMPPEHFLSARRSGDEFCMMLLNCSDKNDIIQYLNQFYQALEQTPMSLSDSQSKIIHASSGFAWTADSNADIDELLNYADEALYDIKRETKGRFGEYHMS
ncbi:MAG: GGDEF domain-containing protein [Lachnospira sp.]|nr:GGDEF domain-containing protein [Lachnospira sp.]